MTVNKIEQVLELVSNMTVLEVVELVKAMEEKFGVSAQAQVVAAGPAQGPVAAAEEQTEFKVVMASFAADKKIGVIKEIRTITGLGLQEAKAMVEGVPSVVKEGLSKADAEAMKKQLETAGATVEIK